MKKLAIGITLVISFFTAASFAATTVTKNDTTIPCYNGGFSFGLAGYYLEPSSPSTSTADQSNLGNTQVPQVDNKVTDYK